MTVASVGTTPVKSTQFHQPSWIDVQRNGVVGDRRFVIVHANVSSLRAVDKRPFIPLRFVFDAVAQTLIMKDQNGSEVRAAAEAVGPAVRLDHFGIRTIECREVAGEWSSLLSDIAGFPVRLMRVEDSSAGFDVFPITLLTTASMAGLDGIAGARLDSARFRPTLVLNNAEAHQEDGWEGLVLRAGEVRMMVRGAVPRCVVTSLDPRTGRRDVNVLRHLASYRPRGGPPELVPDGGAVMFAVYADVVETGRIRVGDTAEIEGFVPD